MERKPQGDDSGSADLDTYPPWLVNATGSPVFSQVDWQMTPRSVRASLWVLHGQYQMLVNRMEKLEQRLGSDSSTSNKPPSTDSSFTKKLKEKFRKKPGGKKGHPGHRQEMLEPTETVSVEPKRCPCGYEGFGPLSPFHIPR